MASRQGSLVRFIGTRVLLAVPMVLLLLTLVFLLMRVAPGDPISSALGGKLSAAELAKRRAEAGFDRPVLEQYLDYLKQIAHLDFGRTITDNRKVTDIFVDNGGATLTLSVAALVVALVIGLPLGLVSGRRRDSAADVVIRLFGIVTYAAPVFFVGLLLQLVLGKELGWLPTSGQASPVVEATTDDRTHILLVDLLLGGDTDGLQDGLRHLVLPAVTLGLLVVGVLIRLVRVNLIGTLQSDYVEAARARGVRERIVVRRHGFRNALVPVVTVMGLQVAALLGGAVLTEETFNWPGVGNELVHYLNNRDYTAVQGIVTAFALVVVAVSLVIDVVNALIDPRIRY
ncbi:peptide/nickel transport system permease protein [Motilibacter rhizosphaerae]|uniref:Peptide/nickel transport system permease protein n=1 Tax=Motilibacter rhizosphaerae TaxID=598652 RepID=A0A4Q7NWD0_9ACTN|nr:ABC transporter permease [Motilibacter rhizosphaerae]RZS91484.1 peptide/nickel transport system permease protein [Motilibacter rhizosphaerae]